jgi:ParB-like chromosome segregation protein Spo0J
MSSPMTTHTLLTNTTAQTEQYEHMTEQTIPVECLTIEKPDTTRTPFTKDFCHSLADSITKDGLIQLPVVMPVAGKPGTYKVICGRKRVYTCAKILNWTDIPCRVATDLDEQLAKAMEYAENLFRMGLDELQTKLSIKDWSSIHQARYPLAHGTGANFRQKKEAAKQVDAEIEAEKSEPTTEERAERIDGRRKEIAEENTPFYQVLMNALGIAKSSAERLCTIVNNLTEDQLKALHASNCNDEVAAKLASLKDQEEVDNAIKMIAAGMSHDEAVRVAQKTAGAKAAEKKAAAPKARSGGKKKAAGSDAEEEASTEDEEKKRTKEADLTDDEWLARHCHRLLALLQRKGPFRRDAILYRRIYESVARIRKPWKKYCLETRHPDGNGFFFHSVAKISRMAHPRDWLVCGTCMGTGKDKETEDACKGCYGGAYHPKLEDWT